MAFVVYKNFGRGLAARIANHRADVHMAVRDRAARGLGILAGKPKASAVNPGSDGGSERFRSALLKNLNDSEADQADEVIESSAERRALPADIRKGLQAFIKLPDTEGEPQIEPAPHQNTLRDNGPYMEAMVSRGRCC